ncbi:MAG: hypothetical protein JNL74_07600 [Fibrobacteres bacterium]|nr:hypothetical protein [Fibrobacterota bacterium]
MIKSTLFILSVFGTLFSQIISFDTIPETLHFYARDTANMAKIVVKGSVSETGHAKVSLLLSCNGTALDTAEAALTYGSSGAAFRLAQDIRCGLYEYSIKILLDGTEVAKADSIVCGDVILINGQSNSVSDGQLGVPNEFIRTYELPLRAWTYGSEGVWPHRVGERIIREHNVPVAIMSGGASSTGIVSHVPGSNHYDSLLKRVILGGVQHNVKMLFWYQGENDTRTLTETKAYPGYFDILYKAWIKDYPGIEKIYICQINMWFKDLPGYENTSCEFREYQRTLANTYDKLEVIATVGTASEYGGHYGTKGYRKLGDRIYPLVSSDFYEQQKVPGVSSPNIKRAYYSTAARDEITLLFDQPVYWQDADTAGHKMKDYFYLDTAYGMVTAGKHNLAEKSIVLTLSGTQNGKAIRYLPDGWYHEGGNVF